MAATLVSEVEGFLKDLGFDVATESGTIRAVRDAYGAMIAVQVKVEDRRSMGQLPNADVYFSRFPAEAPDARVERWVVTSKDAAEAEVRFRDFQRAMKEQGVKVGVLSSFLDSFISRRKLRAHVEKLSQSLAHGIGYVPQRIVGASGVAQQASPALQQWIMGRGEARLGVLQAPAGWGKSVLAERVVLDLHDAVRGQPERPTPFLVKFADHPRVSRLNDLLLRELAQAGLSDVTVPALQTLIRRGRVILVFDGLDELVEEAGDRVGLENLQQLAGLIRRDTEGKVLVTCRSTFLASTGTVAEGLREAETWELAEFNRDDQRAYLEGNPPEGVSGAEVARHRDRVITSLERDPLLGELASSPFLLSLISQAVSSDRTRLPENVGKLYESFLFDLCEREVGKKKHDLTSAAQVGFLADVAHNMVYEQAFAYPDDLLAILIGDYFAQDIAEDLDRDARRQELVRKLTDHAAFAPETESAPAGIRFLHESIRDFGAARYLLTLASSRAATDLLRSAICRRELPEQVVRFMADLAEREHLSELGTFAARTDGVFDDANVFRVAAASPLTDAPVLAFPTRECAGIHVTGRVDDADLSRFTFVGCDLSGVQFDSCRLIGTNFEESLLTRATFVDCDLSEARFPTGSGVVWQGLEDQSAVERALLTAGAVVGGKRLEIPPSSTSAADLVRHVLHKCYSGASASNARRRSRYEDVLERGCSATERKIIRDLVVPLLKGSGVLVVRQRGTRTIAIVAPAHNAVVVGFVYRNEMHPVLDEAVAVAARSLARG